MCVPSSPKSNLAVRIVVLLFCLVNAVLLVVCMTVPYMSALDANDTRVHFSFFSNRTDHSPTPHRRETPIWSGAHSEVTRASNGQNHVHPSVHPFVRSGEILNTDSETSSDNETQRMLREFVTNFEVGAFTCEVIATTLSFASVVLMAFLVAIQVAWNSGKELWLIHERPMAIAVLTFACVTLACLVLSLGMLSSVVSLFVFRHRPYSRSEAGYGLLFPVLVLSFINVVLCSVGSVFGITYCDTGDDDDCCGCCGNHDRAEYLRQEDGDRPGDVQHGTVLSQRSSSAPYASFTAFAPPLRKQAATGRPPGAIGKEGQDSRTGSSRHSDGVQFGFPMEPREIVEVTLGTPSEASSHPEPGSATDSDAFPAYEGDAVVATGTPATTTGIDFAIPRRQLRLHNRMPATRSTSRTGSRSRSGSASLREGTGSNRSYAVRHGSGSKSKHQRQRRRRNAASGERRSSQKKAGDI